LTGCADILQDMARACADERGDTADNEVLAWAALLRDDIRSHARDVECLVPWIHFANNLDASSKVEAQAPHTVAFRKQLTLETHLSDLSGCYALSLADIEASSEGIRSTLANSLRRAGEQVEALTKRLENMAAELDTLFYEMDFRFLYDTNATCSQSGTA
jgi:cyclic beta-1,2-glucan synthetase